MDQRRLLQKLLLIYHPRLLHLTPFRLQRVSHRPQTPPAAELTDPALSKTRRLGPLQTTTHTRRSLLRETSIADKETIQNEDADADTSAQKNEDTTIASSLMPKPKRLRTKGSKQHSKDSAGDSSPVRTPE